MFATGSASAEKLEKVIATAMGSKRFSMVISALLLLLSNNIAEIEILTVCRLMSGD
jgi:hypothetical protein